MSINRQHSDRRVRVGLVLLLVLAGTALIGWGGLAAWQAVTQNNNSYAQTDGVHMQNVATITYPSSQTPVTCTDQTSPSSCGAIFQVSSITPGFSQPAGTVQITNIGTEASNFTLNLKSAAVSADDSFWTASDTTLCADLQLAVVDSEATPRTVYSGSLASMTSASLYSSLASTTWNPGDSDTFTFTVSLPTSSPNTDEDSKCTAVFTWGQNGV